MADYRIELGIGLNDSDFNSVKNKIKGLEDDGIKIKLDTSTVDKQIDSIKTKLKGLDNIGIDLGTDIKIDGNSAIKSAKQIGQKVGTAVTKDIQKSLNFDDSIVSNQVTNLMKNAGIAAKKGSKDFKVAFDEIKQAYVKTMSGMGSVDDVIHAIAKNVKRVDVEKQDALRPLLNQIQSTRTDGSKILIPKEARDTFGKNAYNMRASLGNGFVFKNGSQDLENYITENLSNFIDMSKMTIDEAFGELVSKYYEAKNPYYSVDELFSSGNLNHNAMADEIVASFDIVRNGQNELVQSSKVTTDTVVQDSKRQQEAIRANLEAKKAEIEQEKKRLAEINKSVDDYNNRFLEASTTGDPNAMEYYAKMQSLEAEGESLKSHIDALDAAYNKEVELAQESANAISQNEERKQQAYQETANVVQSISKQTSLVRDNVDFKQVFDGGNQSAKEAQRYFEDLLKEEKAVISVKENFDSSVGDSGALKSFTVDIQRATGEIEKLHYAMSSADDNSSFLYQGASVSDKNIEKQTEARIKSANRLQTELEEIKTKYEDMGAAKPIKDSDHIDALDKQYRKVEKSINDIRNADNTMSASMISNAEKQKSILESMVREYRNAENLATSLRSKDINTVGATYSSDLDVLISKMRKDGVYTSGFEKGAENLRSILSDAVANKDKSGLVGFLNGLDKLEAGYKRASAAKKEFNQSESVGIDTSTLRSKIENLQRISPEINKFETEINGARVTVKSLLNDLDNIKVRGDFNVVNKRFNSFEKAAESAGIAVKELSQSASNASFTKEINQDLDNFIKLQKQIENTRFEIGKLEITGDSTNQIAELKRQLEELENTYDKLMQAFLKKVSVNADIVPQDALSKLDNGITEATTNANNRLEQFKAKWADTRTELAKSIKADIELGNIDNQMDAMRTNFNSLSDANDKLRNSFEATEKAYKAMVDASKANTGDEVTDRERLIQAEKEYAAALEKTNNLIKQQARADKIFEANKKLSNSHKSLELDMVNWLKNNSRAAKEYENQIYDLIGALNKLEQSGNLKQIDVNSTRSQFNLLTKDAERRGLTGLTVWDKLLGKAKEYAAYLSAAEIFMYVEQAFRSMFEQVKLIDSAMTELKKVTDETDASYNNFLSDASSRAKEIGTTIDGLVSSTADFARLGYSMSEATELAEVANIYSVVGDDIESVETATESLISTMTAFGVEASNSMSIVDKFNAVGNNFAISSGGIGEALERSASSMAAANNSLDETIALITAANTVVQDPASVGQAFKTISMRIRGAKTELEDAGLDAEGMADSTAKLRQEIMALSGVDIMLDD